MSHQVSDITVILERMEQGDSGAAAELLRLVYAELRRLASHQMALFAPLEDKTGVAPPGPNVSGDIEVSGVVASMPPVMGNACSFPFPAAT